MRFPNHIILDSSKMNCHDASQYWVSKFFKIPNQNDQFFKMSHLKYKTSSFLTKRSSYKKEKNFTIICSLDNPTARFSAESKKLFKKLFKNRLKVTNRVRLSKHFAKIIYRFLTLKNPQNNYVIPKVSQKTKFKEARPFSAASNLWNLFDISFLKKEKVYTKLKYSRTPQYDIVSGGVAAIFAGFLGFLICEKFGLELLDSGDFYFFFMYLVFLGFFIKLLFKLINGEEAFWNIFSYKWFFLFYKFFFLNLIIKKKKL